MVCMRASLRNFLRGSIEQRRLIIEALLLLPVARMSLATCGFGTTRVLFEALFPLRENATRAPHLPELTKDSVQAAARHSLVETTCLPQSLVLWSLLRRQGFAPILRIGGKRVQRQFHAHAWVEVSGLVLDAAGDETHTFVPFR